MTDRNDSRPDRLATIGELAAGIAHEINNPVAYVRSNLDTLDEYLGDLLGLIRVHEAFERSVAAGEDPASRPDLDAARRSTGYDEIVRDLPGLLQDCRSGMELVAGIVQALRDFARETHDSQRPVDVNQIVQRALVLARNSLKYKAEVTTRLDELPMLACHPGRLTQLVLNLLVNAAEALDSPGEVLVRTEHTPEGIALYVADTGPGIDPDVRERIFQPFFTTKQDAAGTGMGLAVAREIAGELGGAIELTDLPGYSTCFRVQLPLRRS